MGFLTGLFALASLVWLIPLMQRGRLFVVAMLVLAIGTILGPSFFYVDGPIQLSLDRMLWFLMVGLAFLGVRLGHTNIPKLTRPDWAVVGIVIWFFYNAVRGGPAPEGVNPIAPWIFFVVIPAGLYGVVRAIKITRKDMHLLVYGAIGLGVYLGLTAICEWRGWHALVYPKYIVDASIWEFYGRARGPLMQPVGNGILLGIALVASIAKFLESGRAGKVGFGLTTFIILLGMYGTLTRSVWIGAALIVAMFVFFHSPRWVRALGLVVVLCFGAAMFLGLKEQLTRIKRDKALSAADAEKSVKLRPLLAIVAWEMFKDKPIAGHGVSRYPVASKPYHTSRKYGMPLEQARDYIQHNVLLSIMVDTGLIGLSLFVAWIVMLASIGWRLVRDRQNCLQMRWAGQIMLGMLLVYMLNGMFHDVMLIVMLNSFLFFLAGVCVTVHQQQSLAETVDAVRSPVRRTNMAPATVGA